MSGTSHQNVTIFLLMIFVIAQFFLSDALSGRDKALDNLKSQVSELAELLSLERETVSRLYQETSDLSEELKESLKMRTTLSKEISLLASQVKIAEELSKNRKESLDRSLEASTRQLAQINSLRADIERLLALKQELEKKVGQLLSKASTQNKVLTEQKDLSKSALARIALLNRQIKVLKKQMSAIAETLETSEAMSKRQRIKIANLGKRLNSALASKVQELSRYRSEFFGRLREVLGSQPGIQIVGDRFVFQSEVLFSKGSDKLETRGRKQIIQLANMLKDITKKIPKNIDWILRVDGHTDQVPIRTGRFPSNWELSTARAISVIQLLIEQGIAPSKLAATGFGEFQPIDPATNENAYRRNRRIELKLTQR